MSLILGLAIQQDVKLTTNFGVKQYCYSSAYSKNIKNNTKEMSVFSIHKFSNFCIDHPRKCYLHSG